jgi:hypothetical protein
VHAVAAQGIQVDGKGSDEGLALTGLHLGDLALVQDDAADQLNVEGTHLEGAARGLADDRKAGDQQIVDVGSLFELLPEFLGLGA